MPKVGDSDERAALCRQDVSFVPQGAILAVRKTKTIQCGERILRIPLHVKPDSHLCPVAALQAVWDLPPVPLDQPLFSFATEDSVQVLDYKTFTNLLRTTLSAAGIDCGLTA